MQIIIEDHDGFHKSDPSVRMDMLIMALKRAGYQLRGKPMPSWGCEPTTLVSPYQCGNNWMPIIVGCGLSKEVALTQQVEPELLSCAYCGDGSTDQICHNPECTAPELPKALQDIVYNEVRPSWWAWRMDWCKSKGLHPGKKANWDASGKAHQAFLAAEPRPAAPGLPEWMTGAEPHSA